MQLAYFCLRLQAARDFLCECGEIDMLIEDGRKTDEMRRFRVARVVRLQDRRVPYLRYSPMVSDSATIMTQA